MQRNLPQVADFCSIHILNIHMQITNISTFYKYYIHYNMMRKVTFRVI